MTGSMVRRLGIWVSSFVWMGHHGPLLANDKQASLSAVEQHRTNGPLALHALKPLAVGVSACALQVLDDQNQPLQLAVRVSEDGYFLTKASELQAGGSIRVRSPEGGVFSARRVHEEKALDLLLAKADGLDGTAAPWSTPRKMDRGAWVIAPTLDATPTGLPLRLGVISATKRPIPPGGAGMGIRMRDDLQLKAVRILEVSADGPARTAGLREGDVVVAVDDEATPTADRLQSILRRHQPGDEVKVDFKRNNKLQQQHVRLASLAQVVSNFDGEDYGNGGVSIRTDGFPMVLQHATPLSPRDMGGALFDLEGNAVGINIARADRVTTFALPTDAFWARAQQWMQKDRGERSTTDGN